MPSPRRTIAQLRRIADSIEASSNPSRELVAGLTRTATRVWEESWSWRTIREGSQPSYWFTQFPLHEVAYSLLGKPSNLPPIEEIQYREGREGEVKVFCTGQEFIEAARAEIKKQVSNRVLSKKVAEVLLRS